MEPFDFDKDLSELEDAGPDDCKDSNCCHCESESGCECEFRDDADMESERSYDGKEADYYYELKEEREERKREKLEKRKVVDRERELQWAKEDEFDAAYESLEAAEEEGKTIPTEPLRKQSFELFCGDAVDYFFHDTAPRMKVDFFVYELGDMWSDDPDYYTAPPGPDAIREDGVPNGEADSLHGNVYLNASTDCNFGPFRAPKQASREALTLSSDNGDDLFFEFIGNGFLRLTLSREMVFTRMRRYHSPPPPPRGAPEYFEFVGILRDFEKEAAERKERLSRRARSPRETWFELNHPMGLYR